MEKDSPGDLLRDWRKLKRLSQLDLALEAGISQRHLSFLESGRAKPSREMVLLLAHSLSLPLREQNRMLLAAGFAPSFPERSLDDPALKPAMDAVQRILDGHAPNPAIAINRHWNMIASNEAIAPFLVGVEETSLLSPPVNVLRLSLHPKGIAPRIVNLPQWRNHVLERLKQLNGQLADPQLYALEKELAAYPVGPTHKGRLPAQAEMIAVPLHLRVGQEELSFITTTTIFGTPLDVTLSELALETFFPADDATARYLRQREGLASK